MIKNVLSTFCFFSEKWKLNTLSALVNYFSNERGQHIVLGSPIIKFTTDSDESDGRYVVFFFILYNIVNL